MAKAVAQPPHLWESFRHEGKTFVRFDLRLHGDRMAPFSIAQPLAGRYELQDVLARGGGGVILVARDLKTEHLVLVKALAEYDVSRHDLEHPLEDIVESLRRSRHHLQTERRLLVRLRNRGCNAVPHPNDFVFDANPLLQGPHRALSNDEWRFDDEGILNSEPYLVMQHVAGLNLKDVIVQFYRNGLEELVALRIIDQVARVLELLQQPLPLSNGQTWSLVYQDLKPGNIVVDEHGHATVLDFGGCQLEIDGTLVLHGSHSPGYCAPECGQGKPIDATADSFALGSTLYHMLSGESPRTLLPKDRQSGDPPAAHIDANKLSKKCSAGVVSLIARCVDWDREARFQTAVDFRQALVPLLSWT
jgi:serine/threonine protein kinase